MSVFDDEEELERRFQDAIREENIRQYRERLAVKAQSTASGPYTGRCPRCRSTNLWSDNLAYGCQACGALLGT